MQNFNIYICGVGGQGIGLLNEILIRAASDAGLPLKGVDTHGLAQRGGIVQSHLKLGNNICSPMISPNGADLIIALEIHEALRALPVYLKPDGKLVYYDTEWQPSEVRLFKKGRVSYDMIISDCRQKSIEVFKVYSSKLPSSKMQNIAVISAICKNSLIPDITKDNYLNSMKEVIKPELLDLNLEIFEQECAGS